MTEPLPAGFVHPDPIDAFEVARQAADQRSAEECARDGFERQPLPAGRGGLIVHRWALGFQLGPWASPDHAFGWKIVISEPEVLDLEARSRMLSGHMVWRLDDTRLTMTTLLRYEMRRMGSAVWAVLGTPSLRTQRPRTS